MSDKKSPKKPKLKPSLTQKERFIEYAKKIGVDETGEEFERALDKVLPPKKKWFPESTLDTVPL